MDLHSIENYIAKDGEIIMFRIYGTCSVLLLVGHTLPYVYIISQKTLYSAIVTQVSPKQFLGETVFFKKKSVTNDR